MSTEAEAASLPEDDADFAARFADQDDNPAAARLRHLLVRKFATTQAFNGQPVTEFPHLAADAAMRIVGPVLAVVAADAKETVRTVKAAAGDAAEETVARRLQVIEAAVRASERAACVAFLRDEALTLAAAALEAPGPDAVVAARDAAGLSVAARSLVRQSAAAR